MFFLRPRSTVTNICSPSADANKCSPPGRLASGNRSRRSRHQEGPSVAFQRPSEAARFRAGFPSAQKKRGRCVPRSLLYFCSFSWFRRRTTLRFYRPVFGKTKPQHSLLPLYNAHSRPKQAESCGKFATAKIGQTLFGGSSGINPIRFCISSLNIFGFTPFAAPVAAPNQRPLRHQYSVVAFVCSFCILVVALNKTAVHTAFPFPSQKPIR